MASTQASSNLKKGTSSGSTNHSSKKPGIVSVVDVVKSNEHEMFVHDEWSGEGLVAHFIAHSSDPITSLTFDPSGTLLVTSDQQGRYFHLFKILVHPQRSSLSTVHHLYVLQRGDTTAKIQSVAFTWDARWVAVSTVHGTTHVFPITSYGGPVNKRTHMSKRVVSRASRFHRSAGLEESFDRFKKSGRDSPASSVTSGSTPAIVCGNPSSLSSTSLGQQFSASPVSPSHLNKEVHLINQLNNPRLPPYPYPTVVHPLAQIRQSCATIPGLDITTPITCSSRHQNKIPTPERRTVVACFSNSRVMPPSTGSPCVSKDRLTADKSPLESLFVATTSGILMEYVLNVRPRGSLENVTDDSPIDVEAVNKLQWALARLPSSSSSGDMFIPHSLSNPLLSSGADRPFNNPKSSSGSRSRKSSTRSDSSDVYDPEDVFDEEWLSQVEIATHAPPYRRLWMGPQFSFHLYQDGNIQFASPLTLPSLETDRTASSSSSSSSLSKQNISDDLNHDLRFTRTSFKSQAKDFRTISLERRDAGGYLDQSSRDSPTLRASSSEDMEEQLRANLAEAISDETSTDFLFNQDLLDNIDLQECDESESGSDAWTGCFGEKGRGLSVSPCRSSDSN